MGGRKTLRSLESCRQLQKEAKINFFGENKALQGSRETNTTSRGFGADFEGVESQKNQWVVTVEGG